MKNHIAEVPKGFSRSQIHHKFLGKRKSFDFFPGRRPRPNTDVNGTNAKVQPLRKLFVLFSLFCSQAHKPTDKTYKSQCVAKSMIIFETEPNRRWRKKSDNSQVCFCSFIELKNCEKTINQNFILECRLNRLWRRVECYSSRKNYRNKWWAEEWEQKNNNFCT